MVKVYNDINLIKEKYHLCYDTRLYFEDYTLLNQDFSKYDIIFQDIEQPEWINYDFWCLKNRFGKCSFTKLSTGMRNLMNYLYFGEQFKSGKDYRILDVSKMGPNVQYYLFKYANYYEVPFHFLNFNTRLFTDLNKKPTGNPIIDYPAKDIKINLDGRIYTNKVKFMEAYHKTIETYTWRIG